MSTPPDPTIVTDPIASSKITEPMPIEYAPHWTGELEIGMAQHFDTMDMIMAREAYKRWLKSEKTSNRDRDIWQEILNKNPNVGIVSGKITLWGKDAAGFLDAISYGPQNPTQNPTPDKLTSNQDVLDDLYCLWKRGGYGFQPTERAEWITQNAGKYGSTPWPWSATVAEESWKGPLPAGTIALAHTHPEITSQTSRTGPKPSTTGGNTGRGDQGTADKLGLPVYVVTRNAIWKAVPNAKDPVQVAGKDWWKPSEKAKVKCK